MYKLAATTFAFGTVLAVGAAQAEPLTLTTDQMDNVTAAGFAFVDGQLNVRITEDILKRVDVLKRIDKFQFVDVEGYFAEANGGANCFSPFGCQSTSFSIVDVHHTSGFATSVSGAEAATDGFTYDYSNVTLD